MCFKKLWILGKVDFNIIKVYFVFLGGICNKNYIMWIVDYL